MPEEFVELGTMLNLFSITPIDRAIASRSHLVPKIENYQQSHTSREFTLPNDF